MKQIIVEIDNDGNVIMEGIGFKGTACDKAMAALEQALGVPSNRKNKPEYTACSVPVITQKVGGK